MVSPPTMTANRSKIQRGSPLSQKQPHHKQQQQHAKRRKKNVSESSQSSPSSSCCTTPKYSKQYSSSPSSPQLLTPSRSSPSRCFASSKCFEPPTPEALPRPPTNWMMTPESPSSIPSHGSKAITAADLFHGFRMNGGVNPTILSPAVTATRQTLLKVQA